MGRIHRYKQEREVMIWNIVAENTREGEVMERLLSKLDDMRQALGSDRVYDVIGEIIPAPRFDALMKDWLSRRRTMSEILAEIDLQTDVEQVQRIRADMEDKALGARYIDTDDPDQSIAEFRSLSGKGHSRGWRFNRDEIHSREPHSREPHRRGDA